MKFPLRNEDMEEKRKGPKWDVREWMNLTEGFKKKVHDTLR